MSTRLLSQAAATIELSSDEEPEQESEDEIAHEDYQEIRDIPSPPPKETSLADAIINAPHRELRMFLIRLTEKDAALQAAIAAKFLKPVAMGKKRKAFEKCRNCEEDYHVDQNFLGACVYHEESQEVNWDDDFWADHDPNCHGDPEHPDLMKDSTYRDGYNWSCCEKDMDAEGCVISRHVPKSMDALKRGRF